MTVRRKNLAWLLLAGVAVSHGATSPVDLFQITTGSLASAFEGAHVIEAQRVEPVQGVLLQRPGSIHMQLPDGSQLVAQLKNFRRRAANDVTWIGTVESNPSSRVVLTARNGIVTGAILGLDYTYLIEPLSDGGTVFKTVDPGAFPECAGALTPRATGGISYDVATTEDTGDQIDLMLLYTPQARDAAGGVAGIEATAQSAVDITNVAFADSDVTTRFRLVHTGLSTHNDAGDMGVDLTWLQGDASVAALRDTHGADLVSLVVSDGGGSCGIGYVMRNVGPGFQGFAFQVTARTCAVGNLSFAHEHGHNMGMEHDPANGVSPGDASYPWSFGHNVDGSYRTVMSYSNQCPSGCTRVPHFSNPSISHNGVPTGIVDQRDNHRTANLVASTTANFRQQVCSLVSNLQLELQTVSTTEVFEACESITAGNNFVVGASADVTFLAGDHIYMQDGFRVVRGGRFTARIE